jgi:hypothetical protein
MLKLLFKVIINKFRPIEPVVVQQKEEVTEPKKPAVKRVAAKKPAVKKVVVKKPAVKKAK